MGAQVRLGNPVNQATLMAAAEGVGPHLALRRIGERLGPPDAFVQANVDGVRNILAVATRAQAKRFVYLSTSDVYGFPGNQRPTVKPAPRGLPYVDSKIEGESLVWNHYRKVNLPVTVIRPGTVYGPRSNTLVLPITRALLERRGYTIDKGKHLAGLCYVGNLVDAMLLAGDAPEAVGQAYNVTDGSAVTWAQFIHTLADALQMPRPERDFSHWRAYALASILESLYTIQGKNERPWITRMGVELMGSDQTSNRQGTQPASGTVRG